MNNLEKTLKFLEEELKESEESFNHMDASYNPYVHIGQLTALVRIAIKRIKEELGK